MNRSARAAEWRRLVLPLGTGLLLLGALFIREVAAAVQTWSTSTAYNHCFLIIPIVIYLLWDRRGDFGKFSAHPAPAILLLGLPVAGIWLVSERLGIMEGRQLAAVTFAEILFLSVLGKRLWWAMAGPLLYLYFLVPFGEFLTPGLQDITTWFIRHGLEVLGVPAFIDGYTIEIPQGTFFVAEACAGLRFLIASIAFGCLYALMIYRSPLHRGLFILVSIIVPVVANGLRAVGIVYLGFLLGSAEAAAADHLIYGWIFFSLITLILIMLGLPFRQDQIPARSASLGAVSASVVPIGRMLAVALAVVVVAAITPAVAAALSATSPTESAAVAIDPGPGCFVRPAVPASHPRHIRAQRVVCDEVAMDMTWETFSTRSTAAPLMAERRRLVLQAATENVSENWLETYEQPSAWRIMRSSDPAFMIAVSMWVDGRPVRPGLALRTRMALNSLFGATVSPMVLTVTPAVNWDALNATERRTAEASLPAFLLAHPNLGRTTGMLPAP